MNENLKKLYETKEINMVQLNRLSNLKIINLSMPSICSLKCNYCVANMYKVDGLQNGVINEIGIEEYIKRIDYLFSKYYPINFQLMGGGEPTENPYFLNLAKYILENGNSLTVTTNLNGIKNIIELSKMFPKETMKKIQVSSSYHLGAYLDKKDPDKWRNRYLYDWIPKLIDSGLKIGAIITPLTPKCLFDDKIVKEMLYLKKLGFTLRPCELVGKYDNKIYPGDYTEKESENLIRIMKEVHEVNDLCELGRNQRSLNPNQIKHITRQLFLKDMPCSISMSYCKINVKGYISNCPGRIVGNIKDYKNVKQIFYEDPQKCPSEKCNCRTSGKIYSLGIYDLNYTDYYHAYYLDQEKTEIAKYFKNKE